MIKTDTWLPIFSGFYNSIWDADDDSLEYDLKEQCDEHNFSEEQTQEMADFLWNSANYRDARNEYCHDVTKQLTTVIEGMLIELGMIHKIVYQTIVSPKEYNYMNDSVNVQIQLRKSHVRKLKKYLKNNADMWAKYLEERYTSYDGFWSHHDNYPDSEQWQVADVVQHPHRLSSLLQFILLNEHTKNLSDGYALDDSLEYELYAEVQGNVGSCYVDFDSILQELVEERLEKNGMPVSMAELVVDKIVRDHG